MHRSLARLVSPPRLARLALVASAGLLLLSALAAAQPATGTMRGVVVDSAGAVVSGATIGFTNQGTNQRRETTTDAEGRFLFAQMPPAIYTVRAEHAGFRPAQVADLTVNVGDERLIRLELHPGGVEEAVVVRGAASTVQDSMSVGTVIDRQFVANLPLSGRSFQALFDLTPGVQRSTENGQLVVNGQRPDTNGFLVDGVSANVNVSQFASGSQVAGQQPTLSVLNTTTTLVSVDALQEFRILTSTFAPEYGRTPGGQVSLVTRSGTNRVSGTAFEYFRNERLDANDWFANRAGIAKPPSRQHDFGGVLGGPVYLPGPGRDRPLYDGHDRTFFFLSYEGLRLSQPQVANTFVFSRRAREEAPAAIRPILDAYPLPTGPEIVDAQGQPTGAAPFTASYADPSETDSTSVRIDQILGASATLFGRYSHAPSSQAQRLLGTASVSEVARNTRSLTLGHTWAPASRVSNDLRVNATYATASSRNTLQALDGAVPVPDTALFPSFVGSDRASLYFFLDFGSVIPALPIGNSADNATRQINIVENVTLNAGSHAFKVGADYRRFDIQFGTGPSISANFPTMAELNTGVVPSYDVTAREGLFEPVVQDLSLFAQDTWRASGRLTVTYGVRWELNPAPSERNGQELTTLTGADSPATLDVVDGRPLFATRYGNVAPRIGAAYQLRQHPRWETVLRGGWGRYYDLGTTTALQGYEGYPYRITVPYPDVALPVSTNAEVTMPAFRRSPPYSTVVGYAPDFDTPRTYQWNVTLEQALGASQTASIAYVGAAGRELIRTEGYSRPNPRFSDTVHVVRNMGRSDYESLQLQYTWRQSAGLQALAAYTWSHSTDTASSSAGIQGIPTTFMDAGLQEGDSDFDVRHNVAAAVTYELPAPSSHRVMRAVLGGFSLDGMFKFRTGTPVNAQGGSLPAPFTGNFRPNIVPGVPFYLDDPTSPGGRRFNPAAFQVVPGQQGNAPRNVLRGFGTQQVDLSLRKEIPLAGRAVRMQLRLDAFNAFNHPNFANPTGIVTSPSFGRSTQMLNRALRGINSRYEIGGPRSGQLSIKLLW